MSLSLSLASAEHGQQARGRRYQKDLSSSAPSLQDGNLESAAISGVTAPRLASPYRLAALQRVVSGATIWRSRDERLNRDISAWIVSSPFAGTRLLSAARAAAAVADARLTRIFDSR